MFTSREVTRLFVHCAVGLEHFNLHRLLISLRLSTWSTYTKVSLLNGKENVQICTEIFVFLLSNSDENDRPLLML